MAFNRPASQPGFWLPGDVDRPQGNAKSSTTPTSKDGSPWSKLLIDDYEGWFQGLLFLSGITPSGNPDTVLVSDYLDALAVLTVQQISSVASFEGLIGFGSRAIDLRGWNPGTNYGGDIFVWDGARLRSEHDGGFVISPAVPWTGDRSDFLAGVGDPDPSKSGVWVRLNKEGINFKNVLNYGALANGVGDDSPSSQSALATLIPANGGVLYYPAGKYLFLSSVFKKMDAGGVLGRGLSILGDGYGVSSIIVGFSGYGFDLEGPTGTFTSRLVVDGLRFTSSTLNVGNGMRITGAARSQINIFCYQMNTGLDLEAVLISQFNITAEECNVGVHQRKSGHFGGDWGVSGCNENTFRGDMGRNRQYAMVHDTIRGVKMSGMHFERNGTEDVAGGGISDTDRGALKFIDPVGSLSLNGCSSEDNGDLEGANEGKGVVNIITSGNVVEPWTLSLNGITLWKTLDGPVSFIYVAQAPLAGYGRISISGGALATNDSYIPSASKPTFNLVATGRNLGVSMMGVDIQHGDTEFSYEKDVDYYIAGMPKVANNGAHHYVKTAEPNELLSELFSDGDVTSAAVSSLRSNVDTILSPVARQLFKGANDAGDEVTYVRLAALSGDSVAAGFETGNGFNVEVADGSGGFDVPYSLHRDGFVTEGLVKKGPGSMNVASLHVNDTDGVGGTFTSNDGKTITVSKGLIIAIV